MQSALCNRSAIGCLAILLCALVEVGSAREPGTVELGLDGALGGIWANNGDPRFAVEMPAQNIRVGVFVTDFLQVEPSVAFAVTTTKLTVQYPFSTEEREERRTDYAVGFGVALAGHLSNDWSSAVTFFKLEPAFVIVAQQTPEWQFALSVAGGVKLPLASRWAGRLELDVGHSFERESHVRGVTVAALKVGFSYFTK